MYLACALTFTLLIHVTLGADCPEESVIAPCDCSNNIIHCGRQVIDLVPVFARLSAQLEQKSFDQFILRDSNVTALPANVFQDISFKKIDLNLNYLLERIDPAAFSSISSSIEMVTLENNFKLGANVLDNDALFKALSTLSNAWNFWMYKNAFQEIPYRAFNSNRGALNSLTHLTLGGFDIKFISNNPFTQLTNLSYLTVYRTSLKTLPPGSISFGGSSNNTKPIDIRFVEDMYLTGDSFKYDTTNWFNIPSSRPVTLGFSSGQPTVSSITYLDECAFGGLLRQNPNNTISIGTLDCSNCDNYWIVKNNFQNRVNLVGSWSGCEDSSDPKFSHCSSFIRSCPI